MPKKPHTDIGVHLGSIHSLDEVPEAFLVAVHLPVSTNEEFPAHVCGFLWRFADSLKRYRRSTRVLLIWGERADFREKRGLFMSVEM